MDRRTGKWVQSLTPVDDYIMLKAEANVRGWPVHRMLSEYAEAYRSMMDNRVAMKRAGENPPEEVKEMFEHLFGGPYEVNTLHGKIDIDTYIDAVAEEYKRVEENHALAKIIARDKAIKQDLAQRRGRASGGGPAHAVKVGVSC